MNKINSCYAFYAMIVLLNANKNTPFLIQVRNRGMKKANPELWYGQRLASTNT